MAGPVCPSCGVAVVPGYVRCPKCHKPLPRLRSTVVEGGTAVETNRKLPLVGIIVAAILVLGTIAYLGMRTSRTKVTAAPVASPTETADQAAQTDTTPSAGGVQAQVPAQPNRPDPGAAADALERSLKRQRLWSTVSVEGNRVDVRSSSCSDPQMGRALDGAIASFKAAGLTKLRCLAQSGAVVTDRDL